MPACTGATTRLGLGNVRAENSCCLPLSLPLPQNFQHTLYHEHHKPPHGTVGKVFFLPHSLRSLALRQEMTTEERMEKEEEVPESSCILIMLQWTRKPLMLK